MTTVSSDFLRIIHDRGFVDACTDTTALDALLREEVVSAYIGYDCTAPSLHVGSLVSIMLLRWLQKTGHRPIVLMGGGTTRIGDPTGRDDARRLMTDAEITANMAGIQSVFAKYLTFGDGPTDARMVNNADWLSTLSYIPFLRDYGRHFSVNRMLTFDSVRMRLERETHMSFLEFNYMILQAYDFLELARRDGIRLQMGGADQWGNIVNGVELGRRCDGLSLFGLTVPLITSASGAKMGKSAQGAVWLNAEQLSPYDFWQFWRNTEDADVGRFLRLFTELPLDEIARLEALEGAEINEAKKVLAHEATTLAHGEAAALAAAGTARAVFEQGGVGEDLPTVTVSADDLAAGIPAPALFTRAGLTVSNGEAKRLIKGGGARLNDTVLDDITRMVTDADLKDGEIKLSAGRKSHALVRVS
ncbi:tyrosine--tRNA ligase [Roseospira visakhapatnamensis]|uniref:Tyrosine--tRNA ligase n=1 Tax=Roseospira visakhapatnamensis TaxID=390880 RepID=A0A7W6WB60_9PROT|nr:tyrosine--tRNA ligase [Roseospira visakhapatnamensis]MBB4267186.1 tyrosyl-tRNA synthetase [Roseospira visakhapatnamensis]